MSNEHEPKSYSELTKEAEEKWDAAAEKEDAKRQDQQESLMPLEHLPGYQKCLIELQRFLEAKTEYKPEKRMMDVVSLLDDFLRPKLEEVKRQLKHYEGELRYKLICESAE